MSESVFVYGAGGFGREVAWLMDSTDQTDFTILGFIDDHRPQPADWPDPRPVLSLAAARELSANASIIIGISSPGIRRKISERLAELQVCMPALVHSSVRLSDRVVFGEGCVICEGNLLTVDIVLGAHVHINLNCTIGHNVRIGDFTSLAPGVHVSGNVSIGRDVYIGTGASIINGREGKPLVIGDGSIIAAGACLTRSADSNALYAGVPAVVKKKW